MFFPENYKKPVLQSIVEASENGWNATCSNGAAAATGFGCRDGGVVALESFGGHLYTNPDNSSGFLNSDEVGR